MTSSPPSSGFSPTVSVECPASPDGNYRQGLRSLRDLTQHLTTRADDSHAAPLHLSPKGTSPSLDRSGAVQTPVRFFALRRIKPHAPPLVRAPVNSFEFQPCGRTPQAEHLMSSLRHRGTFITPHTKCSSFTARTTGVSNPVRSPGFRASASVSVQEAAFATGVPPNIYAFHRYTGNSTSLSSTPVWWFHRQSLG